MIVLRIGKKKIRLGIKKNKSKRKSAKSRNQNRGFSDMLKFSAKIITVLTIFCLLTGFIIRLIPSSKLTPKVIANAKKQKGTIYLNPVGGSNKDDKSGGNRNAEKDNLEITLSVKEKLEKKNYKVIIARDDDTNVKVEERISEANKNKCDLMVSIDRNKSKVKEAYGVNAFISNSKNLKSQYLAASIINEMNGLANYEFPGKMHLGKIGDDEENYIENSKTNMPSCMLFIGSVTNKEDNKKFDDAKDDYANAIANGIDSAYYKIYLSGDNISRDDIKKMSKDDFSDKNDIKKEDADIENENQVENSEDSKVTESDNSSSEENGNNSDKSTNNNPNKFDDDEDSYGDLTG